MNKKRIKILMLLIVAVILSAMVQDSGDAYAAESRTAEEKYYVASEYGSRVIVVEKGSENLYAGDFYEIKDKKLGYAYVLSMKEKTLKGVQYYSSNEDVIEVDKNTGKINAKKTGIVTVTMDWCGEKHEDTFKVVKSLENKKKKSRNYEYNKKIVEEIKSEVPDLMINDESIGALAKGFSIKSEKTVVNGYYTSGGIWVSGDMIYVYDPDMHKLGLEGILMEVNYCDTKKLRVKSVKATTDSVIVKFNKKITPEYLVYRQMRDSDYSTTSAISNKCLSEDLSICKVYGDYESAYYTYSHGILRAGTDEAVFRCPQKLLNGYKYKLGASGYFYTKALAFRVSASKKDNDISKRTYNISMSDEATAKYDMDKIWNSNITVCVEKGCKDLNAGDFIVVKNQKSGNRFTLSIKSITGIKYKSSDENVISINEKNGKMTAKKPGNATVTVECFGKKYKARFEVVESLKAYKNKSFNYKVNSKIEKTVRKKVPSLKITDNTIGKMAEIIYMTGDIPENGSSYVNTGGTWYKNKKLYVYSPAIHKLACQGMLMERDAMYNEKNIRQVKNISATKKKITVEYKGRNTLEQHIYRQIFEMKYNYTTYNEFKKSKKTFKTGRVKEEIDLFGKVRRDFNGHVGHGRGNVRVGDKKTVYYIKHGSEDINVGEKYIVLGRRITVKK